MKKSSIENFIWMVVLAVAIIASSLLTSWLIFGTPMGMLYFLRGEYVHIGRTAISFGIKKPNELVTLRFPIKNLSRNSVQLVGGNSSCECTFVDQLPIKLKGWDHTDLTITVHTPEETGDFNQKVRLFTDVKNQNQIELLITGKVANK